MTVQQVPIPHPLDMQGIDFLSVLDRLDDGVIITDRNGLVLFYNSTQASIDGIPVKDAIGMKVTDIYDLNRRTSIIMQSMTHNISIRNKTFFYRTTSGKVVNSITSSYPLYTTEGEVNGAICFVKDYELLRQSTPMPSREPFHADLANGTKYRFSDIIGTSPWLKKVIGISQKGG